jgi:hypothetical protein
MLCLLQALGKGTVQSGAQVRLAVFGTSSMLRLDSSTLYRC